MNHARATSSRSLLGGAALVMGLLAGALLPGAELAVSPLDGALAVRAHHTARMTVTGEAGDRVHHARHTVRAYGEAPAIPGASAAASVTFRTTWRERLADTRRWAVEARVAVSNRVELVARFGGTVRALWRHGR